MPSLHPTIPIGYTREGAIYVYIIHGRVLYIVCTWDFSIYCLYTRGCYIWFRQQTNWCHTVQTLLFPHPQNAPMRAHHVPCTCCVHIQPHRTPWQAAVVLKALKRLKDQNPGEHSSQLIMERLLLYNLQIGTDWRTFWGRFGWLVRLDPVNSPQ